MAECRLETRQQLSYVACPMTLDLREFGRRVQEGYREVDLYLGERQLEDRGPTIIRYRRGSERGSMDIEVGWLMEGLTEVPPPLVLDMLLAGEYVVAWHDGPYAEIGATARGAMDWATEHGHRNDVRPDPGGDWWACWYEVYLTEPTFGPTGPAGLVEVCLKLADA